MVFPGKETFNENLAHLRIVVFGISKWNRKKIFKCFARFGIITGISDITSRGFAFVQFRTEDAVLEALRTMNKQCLLGNTITVKRDYGPALKRARRQLQETPFRFDRSPRREDPEFGSRTMSFSSTSEDRIDLICEERSETSSRASSVNTSDISVSEECMSETSTVCEDECEPPDDLPENHLEEPTSKVPEDVNVEDVNVEDVPMDICIEESSCSGSERSFHSDSTLDLAAKVPPSDLPQNVELSSSVRVDASTQTIKHYPNPQWNQPSGPNDCFVAQQIGTETYGEKVKGLLTEVGIKYADLYFENLSDAENPIMEYIENSSDAIYGIFICDSDVKEATISVLSDSKLTKNIPLSEAITSLQKHFEAIKVTSWNKFRVMKFFLNPMMATLNGFSTEDMQYAVQYVYQRSTFVDGPGTSSKRRSSCETQARHDVPVFGQT